MIRPAKPEDIDFVNSVLKANGLPEMGHAAFEDRSRECVQRTMLIDEGVGFIAAGLRGDDPSMAYASHLLRFPCDARTLERWQWGMIQAVLEVALEKAPGLQKARARLHRDFAATCLTANTVQLVPGIVINEESEKTTEVVFDVPALFEFASERLKGQGRV